MKKLTKSVTIIAFSLVFCLQSFFTKTLLASDTKWDSLGLGTQNAIMEYENGTAPSDVKLYLFFKKDYWANNKANIIRSLKEFGYKKTYIDFESHALQYDYVSDNEIVGNGDVYVKQDGKVYAIGSYEKSGQNHIGFSADLNYFNQAINAFTRDDYVDSYVKKSYSDSPWLMGDYIGQGVRVEKNEETGKVFFETKGGYETIILVEDPVEQETLNSLQDNTLREMGESDTIDKEAEVHVSLKRIRYKSLRPFKDDLTTEEREEFWKNSDSFGRLGSASVEITLAGNGAEKKHSIDTSSLEENLSSVIGDTFAELGADDLTIKATVDKSDRLFLPYLDSNNKKAEEGDKFLVTGSAISVCNKQHNFFNLSVGEPNINVKVEVPSSGIGGHGSRFRGVVASTNKRLIPSVIADASTLKSGELLSDKVANINGKAPSKMLDLISDVYTTTSKYIGDVKTVEELNNSGFAKKYVETLLGDDEFLDKNNLNVVAEYDVTPDGKVGTLKLKLMSKTKPPKTPPAVIIPTPSVPTIVDTVPTPPPTVEPKPVTPVPEDTIGDKPIEDVEETDEGTEEDDTNIVEDETNEDEPEDGEEEPETPTDSDEPSDSGETPSKDTVEEKEVLAKTGGIISGINYSLILMFAGILVLLGLVNKTKRARVYVNKKPTKEQENIEE